MYKQISKTREILAKLKSKGKYLPSSRKDLHVDSINKYMEEVHIDFISKQYIPSLDDKPLISNLELSVIEKNC